MEILAVEGLSFRYPTCTDSAVSDVSFRLESGDFAVLCGATGCGKSTLLRMLKRELTPVGDISGEVRFCGKPLSELSERESAADIGFVMQSPEQQIVTDKVWHELAFGLENLGVPKNDIARRVAEMASFFGIGPWYGKNTAELSGGQKQLLNLAAVLVMQPKLLVLDEPTAQLDPIAAADFIATLKRLNQELGLTIIMAEHRLEDVIPVCSRLIVMDSGRVIADAPAEKAIPQLRGRNDIICGMPAASRLYAELENDGECPITVMDGRRYIEQNYSCGVRTLNRGINSLPDETALEFDEVFFRYSRNSPDVLADLSFKVGKGEMYCILGGNGSGKTTSLSTAAGLLKPYSGTIKVLGKKLKDYKNRSLYRECLALLPQDVQTVFLKNTVREELAEVGASPDIIPFDLTPLLDKHPYDLSGGQMQLAALAKVMAAKPKLLLLDEPTKGLDANAKSMFIGVLRKLKEHGTTIVIVTHDVEFAALCADRCAMFFGGKIVSEGTPDRFFSENNFYTTAVSRMTRGIFDNAVTVHDAAELCRINGRRKS
ncbi:MAG: energy-coupling factor ABC transporter ATP-binding protein [Ruminococcus sp.]|nr:energy-coupling factor ABC transporter ATP-binding protein [Ruminococcus sp.]